MIRERVGHPRVMRDKSFAAKSTTTDVVFWAVLVHLTAIEGVDGVTGLIICEDFHAHA